MCYFITTAIRHLAGNQDGHTLSVERRCGARLFSGRSQHSTEYLIVVFERSQCARLFDDLGFAARCGLFLSAVIQQTHSGFRLVTSICHYHTESHAYLWKVQGEEK